MRVHAAFKILAGLLLVSFHSYACKSDSGGNTRGGSALLDDGSDNDDTSEDDNESNTPGAGSLAVPDTEDDNDSTTSTGGTGSGSGSGFGGTTITQPSSVTADLALSNYSAGQLNLEPVELVPIDFTAGSLSLLATPDIDEAETKFSWNPAQEPLNSANDLLCAFQLLAAGRMANRGPYIAKGQIAQTCFTSNENMGFTGTNTNNSAEDKKPQEATVVSKKDGNKPMEVQAYFTIPYSKLGLFGTAPEGGPAGVQENANIYLLAKIAEPPTDTNPFGLFSITYQGYKSMNGEEEKEPFWEGYLNVTKNLVDGVKTSDVKMEFHQELANIHGSAGYQFKDGQIHKAIAVMTAAGESAAHDKPIDKSIARTSTQWFWEQIGGDGQGSNSNFQDQSGSFSMVYSAKDQRSATKWVPAAGTCAWWNNATCTSGGGAIVEGSSCTDSDNDGKCDENDTYNYCDGTAKMGPCHLTEGVGCTDINFDGKCDEDDSFYHCYAIARADECVKPGDFCTSDGTATPKCVEEPALYYCSGYASENTECIWVGGTCVDVAENSGAGDGFCDANSNYYSCGGNVADNAACIHVGDVCTDVIDPIGKCDADASFKVCDSVASRADCLAEGDSCTDDNEDDKCDEDTDYFYCWGKASRATCMWDAETPSCRKTDAYDANVFQYGLFDMAGNRIYHVTGYPVETGKVDAWGWPITGWLGNGGLWISGVMHGDTVSIQDPNWSEPKDFTFHDLPGTLRTDYWEVVEAENDFYVTCQSGSECPVGKVGENGEVDPIQLTDKNNTLVLTYLGSQSTIQLDEGSYSYSDLASELHTKLQAVHPHLKGQYSTATNKFIIDCFELATCGSTDLSIQWNHADTTIETVLGYDPTEDISSSAYHSDTPVAAFLIDITTGVNDGLAFEVTYNGTAQGIDVATIPAGTYSADGLATAIASQMNAAYDGDASTGAPDISVNFNGSNQFYFTITNATSLTLLWEDAGSTIASAIGFDTSVGSNETCGSGCYSDTAIGSLYRYDASERAFYLENKKIEFETGVRNSSLYLTFQVSDANGNTTVYNGQTLRYDMYRNFWQGSNLNSANNNEPLYLYEYSSWVDGAYTNIALSCSICPKDLITQADIDGDTVSTGGGGNDYYFSMNDWSVYRDVGNDSDTSNDIKIEFADDVLNANATFDMTIDNGNVPVKYNIYAQFDPGPGALWDAAESKYFWAPAPIRFQDRTIIADDQYNPDDTSSYVGQDLSDLTWGGELTFDSWGLCCIDWEEKSGLIDQWGGKMWGPKFVFGKGATFTAVNDTGAISSGHSYQIAPTWTEVIPHTASDCSSAMINELDSLPNEMTLPSALSASKQNVKAILPPKPKVDSNGDELRVRVTDGVCTAYDGSGNCL